jgi:hypothetical protein
MFGDDFQKYTMLFTAADKDKDNFVNGLTFYFKLNFHRKRRK